MRRDILRILGVGLCCVGVSLFGLKLGDMAGKFGDTQAGFETLTSYGTRTDVRTVKRVTKGKVITLPGGTQVVHVPLIIVHTHNKTIRVPAHNLPIHRVDRGLLSATVAQPLVPVTVTVFVPSDPVTVTSVSTVTSVDTVTTWIPTTITVTLPLTEGGGPDT